MMVFGCRSNCTRLEVLEFLYPTCLPPQLHSVLCSLFCSLPKMARICRSLVKSINRAAQMIKEKQLNKFMAVCQFFGNDKGLSHSCLLTWTRNGTRLKPCWGFILRIQLIDSTNIFKDTTK